MPVVHEPNSREHRIRVAQKRFIESGDAEIGEQGYEVEERTCSLCGVDSAASSGYALGIRYTDLSEPPTPANCGRSYGVHPTGDAVRTSPAFVQDAPLPPE